MATYKSNTQDFRVVTNGTDGNDGVGISSIIPQYYLSTSEDECIGGSWSTEQSWADGYYLWTRSLITWDNGNVSTTEAIVAGAINSANETANEVKGELSLKVGVNDNEQIVSMINASANEICITGDRLVIESTNFTLTAEGKVKCVGGEFSGNITGGSINIGDNFSVSEDGSATLKNGTFTGTVNAREGYFGVFNINEYGLYTDQEYEDSDGVVHQLRYQIAYNNDYYSPGIWFENPIGEWANVAIALGDNSDCVDFDHLNLHLENNGSGTNLDIYNDRVEIDTSLLVGGVSVPTIQCGLTYVTIPASSVAEITVTFPIAFSGVPKVFLSVVYNNYVEYYTHIFSSSSSQFRAEISCSANNSVSVGLQWVAIYK